VRANARTLECEEASSQLAARLTNAGFDAQAIPVAGQQYRMVRVGDEFLDPTAAQYLGKFTPESLKQLNLYNAARTGRFSRDQYLQWEKLIDSLYRNSP